MEPPGTGAGLHKGILDFLVPGAGPETPEAGLAPGILLGACRVAVVVFAAAEVALYRQVGGGGLDRSKRDSDEILVLNI